MADAKEEQLMGEARDVMMTDTEITNSNPTDPEPEALTTND